MCIYSVEFQKLRGRARAFVCVPARMLFTGLGPRDFNDEARSPFMELARVIVEVPCQVGQLSDLASRQKCEQLKKFNRTFLHAFFYFLPLSLIKLYKMFKLPYFIDLYLMCLGRKTRRLCRSRHRKILVSRCR